MVLSQHLRAELRRHRGLAIGALLCVAAAVGSAGPDIVAAIERVLP